MENFEKLNNEIPEEDKPEKSENENEIKEEKERHYQHLTEIAYKLTNEIEHSWQLEFGGWPKDAIKTLEENKIDFGKHLIEKAKETEGEEKMKILQSLNQLFSWVELKSEDIGSTEEERKQLWDKSQEEIKSKKKGLFSRFKRK